MKETILNSFVILAALSAIVISAAGDLVTTFQKTTQQAAAAATTAANVVQIEKTVITAQRPAPDLQLAAAADRGSE